jgi:hypothetical protein
VFPQKFFQPESISYPGWQNAESARLESRTPHASRRQAECKITEKRAISVVFFVVFVSLVVSKIFFQCPPEAAFNGFQCSPFPRHRGFARGFVAKRNHRPERTAVLFCPWKGRGIT